MVLLALLALLSLGVMTLRLLRISKKIYELRARLGDCLRSARSLSSLRDDSEIVGGRSDELDVWILGEVRTG